ncbi:MAG TPA: nitroreductase family protein [Syntrophales bacterium]|jgi:nitroreductase|nr:nitroreductase family protein [Syntrophales bacterium]HRT60735.1 nitroreductase family protein [Syntrophales bacterium]
MEYSELLRCRRSVREYQDRDVPLFLIREILQDTCLAPSAMNGQPWRFVVVNSREWIKRLSDRSKQSLLEALGENPASPLRRYEERLRDETFNVFYNAPCLVLIIGERNAPSLAVDCSLAACYFMFAAAARGLGTCWIGLGSSINDRETLDAIGIPEDCRIIAPVILGYPLSIPDPPEREAPDILRIVS